MRGVDIRGGKLAAWVSSYVLRKEGREDMDGALALAQASPRREEAWQILYPLSSISVSLDGLQYSAKR